MKYASNANLASQYHNPSSDGEFRLLSLATIIMLLAVSMYMSLAIEMVNAESGINSVIAAEASAPPLDLLSI